MSESRAWVAAALKRSEARPSALRRSRYRVQGCSGSQSSFFSLAVSAKAP